jgi:hypothetical protein
MTNSLRRRPVVCALAATTLLLVAACRRSDAPASYAAERHPQPIEDLAHFTRKPIGNAPTSRPWIANVNAVDLDRDGRLDVIVCDGVSNSVNWIRQDESGGFTESVLASDIPGPVHTDVVDFDGDGDLDVLVASMGQIFPNNDKIGAVYFLENDGHEHFTKHVLLEHVARVSDVRAADLDHDGKLDLAVAQFGYDQGEVRWMRNLGNGQFESHILLSLSGAINVCIADLTGDGKPDIVTLISQQWEEIYLFENDGAGNFSTKVIYGSTNEDYGSSNISLCDLNRDGRPDVLYSNGDGFDYAEPGARPWHGVQWLENKGGGLFKYHRIGDLAGAFSPVAVDIDGDHAPDVVAVSGFNDWRDPRSISLMLFQNDGHQNFTPHVLAHVPTHLMTCTVGVFDSSGRPSIVTGGFHAYPPWENISRVSLWQLTPRP